MYNKLSEYYDALLKDDEAVSWWTSFFKQHHHGKSVLELASGTGEITLELAKEFDVDATDLSEEMLEKIKAKDTEKVIKDIYPLDMRNLTDEKQYDNIICFCDSINYILNEEDLKTVISNVYHALNKEGVFMFDMHTEDRLIEFEEPFVETGQLLDVDYQWSITSEERYIYHHFVFYENPMVQEYHTQYVFKVEDVINILESFNFKISLYTDFNQEGIHEGEKIFVVAKK